MMNYFNELFCTLDDLCKQFNETLEKSFISDQKNTTTKIKAKPNLSKAMTIIILFQSCAAL